MATTRKRKGERPDGLIQVALEIGRDANGKRIRKFFYGHTRSEAEAKRDAYKSYAASGSRFNQNISVEEWVDEFKKTYLEGINEAYLKQYYVPLNMLCKELGYKRMVDVTEIDLQQSVNKLKGKSYGTVDKYRQMIKRVFDKARKNKIISYDPAVDIELPDYTRGTHRALEMWEINLILNHWNDPDLTGGLWVMIMLLAGLRRGEMVAVDWKNVNMDARLLEVKQTAVLTLGKAIIEERAKTNAGLRAIPICQPLWDALNTVPESERHGLVCRSAKGKPLSAGIVQYTLSHFCKTLESIAKEQFADPGKMFAFRAHDLRHTFCSLLYSGGVDVKTAAYLMGHAEIGVTMRIYTHLGKEKRQESEAVMLNYFNALQPPK